MWTRYGDVDTGFLLFNELRRRMGQVFEDFEPETSDDRFVTRATGSFPRVNVYDDGAALLVEADIPGLSEKDLRLTVNEATLTLEGERKSDTPEGYSVHRQERGAYKFSRSFTLPTKADPDHSEATVKDGVLTIRLPKAKEAQPRQIAVRSN